MKKGIHLKSVAETILDGKTLEAISFKKKKKHMTHVHYLLYHLTIFFKGGTDTNKGEENLVIPTELIKN